MDNLSKFGMAAGAGGIGSGLASLFGGGGNNPYDAASKYFDQIPENIRQYIQPYINQGNAAYKNLTPQYNNMMGNLPGLQDQYGKMTGQGQGVMDEFGRLMKDPNAVMSQIGGQYQESPGYQWQMNQGMNAANNAAATGGMAGSPEHQQQAATMASGLANQDYWNFMNHGLNLYGKGLEGNAGMFGAGLAGQQGLYNQGLAGMQGINNRGYDASNQMAKSMADVLNQQAQMAFAGQASQNQSQGNAFGNIFGGLGSLAAFGNWF